MKQNKMNKMMVVVLLAVSLVVALAPAALAAGDATGQFTIPSAPQDLIVTPDATMTPQVLASIDVTVTDFDGIGDISKVEVVFYYSSDGSAVGDPLSLSADAQNVAKMTWDSGSWTMAPAGTTWSIETATCVSPSGGTTGTWTFSFKPGTVATETVGSAKWRAYAKVTSSNGLGDATSAIQVDMNINLEIAIGSTIDWGDVLPNSDFGANEEGSIGVTYVSNGDYEALVGASATWDGTPDDATLDDTGVCAGTNEFALKAAADGVLASAVLVDTAGSSIDNAGTQTSEDGNIVSTNALWLKLAEDFDTGTYSGSITYMIVNR